MTIAVKCPSCGLMQMAGPLCKGCGAALGGPAGPVPLPVPSAPISPPPAPAAAGRLAGRSKTFLGILVAVVLVLAGWGLIGFGVFTFWDFRSDLDSGSKAYVDEAVQKITSSWNARELLDRATPELLQAAPPERVERFFHVFSHRLGPLRTYHGSRGTTQFFVSPQTGRIAAATYEAQATFENAEAVIQVRLLQRDGHWRIASFHVNSDALLR
ncbi:MAG: hypothetical protein HYY54_01065 [candidate division NC10 bacterium]|nr:hypothetical protein [candidate division NC10 bacterium]